MEVSRRCVGCHGTDSTENLLRCVAVDNHVVVDVTQREQRRGAWVHLTQKCLSASLSRKAWGRALNVGPALECAALENLIGSKDLAKNRLNG
jgi:hypothetical protein